ASAASAAGAYGAARRMRATSSELTPALRTSRTRASNVGHHQRAPSTNSARYAQPYDTRVLIGRREPSAAVAPGARSPAGPYAPGLGAAEEVDRAMNRPRPFRLCHALREAFEQGYGLAHLRADVLAGLVVGVVALPLSMALAIASGAPPQHGLYTAIVA